MAMMPVLWVSQVSMSGSMRAVRYTIGHRCLRYSQYVALVATGTGSMVSRRRLSGRGHSLKLRDFSSSASVILPLHSSPLSSLVLLLLLLLESFFRRFHCCLRGEYAG
jgi:hypothetical protein